MSYQELDFIFPFIVFAYGAIMTFVLHSEKLMTLAENRLPQELLSQFKTHRILGVVCFGVGAIWSLQNLLTH